MKVDKILKPFKKFGKSNSVNLQQLSLENPEQEKKLEVVLIDCANLYNNDVGTKHFTVTVALEELVKRQRKFIGFGTTARDGRKFGVLLRWAE